ncbi:hypothetical protein [Chamaesiphon sp. VAR_48_metabat_403]|uniref:hypothetical protein n=1 Tax=Chamaesiphon sp. VAR_48_metabat_403 TaxID=2964700 RepID=UPI00286E4482|nr:hypothetical protein [Chamaesiphon sp. VAR_48_metabat_403]
MGKNTKPMLTVLVEGDKLQQFRDYALSKEVSMGWVVNRLLDRVLSGELDVMGDSPSIEKARGYVEVFSTGLTREDVESMIKSSILNLNIPSIDSSAIEELARVSIETALEPIKESVSELETYARSQLAAVRDEIKRAISDRSVTTESIATIETTPAKTTLLKEGEYISFAQLAKQLSYEIPDGVKTTNPRKEGAEDLIAFAASLGQSYGWDGKKQKFYRTEV